MNKTKTQNIKTNDQYTGDWGTVEHFDFLTLLKKLAVSICSFLDCFAFLNSFTI